MKQILARFPIVILLVFGVAILLTACDTSPAPAAKTVTILVGAGRETVDVNGFFPANLRIRTGDTAVWKLNTDELHTVSFLSGVKPKVVVPLPQGDVGDVTLPLIIPIAGGGPTDLQINPEAGFPTRAPGAPEETNGGTGFFSSGFMDNQPPAPGAPPNNTFTLKFTKDGTFKYVCLIHPDTMKGTVEVVPATTADVPTQPDIDAQAKREIEPLLGLVKAAVEHAKNARHEAGPNNTSFWFVLAGNIESSFGDARAQALEFGPKQLTVKAGDTVIWGSSYFHTVTFNPTPPPPEFVIPKPQPPGPPILSINTQILLPAKPAAVYDPTKFYNSGILSPGGDTSWALTFDKPGSYDYICAVHREQGMKGTIVVQPK